MRHLGFLAVLLAACGGPSPAALAPHVGQAEWSVDAADWMICNAPTTEEWNELPDGERQGACTWRCSTYDGVSGRTVVLTFWRGAPPATTWHVEEQYITPAEQAPDSVYGCKTEPTHQTKPAP